MNTLFVDAAHRGGISICTWHFYLPAAFPFACAATVGGTYDYDLDIALITVL